MKSRYIAIAALSLATVSMSCQSARPNNEEKEENEQKVSFNQCPEAVQKTLKREGMGEEIKSVDMEQQRGKTVYEADVKIDGHNYEILVSPQGMLLSKKLDEEDEAKASDNKASSSPKNDHEDDDDKK
ncbi:MAG TPA: hypothetical protein VFW23_16670 [Tepidisphaeraceae bacterium]|nr:hypothetical protein [Tepidisphaeraceae bacterium]